MGSLKLATTGIFIPRKMAIAKNQLAFSFPGAPEKVHLAKEVVQSRESLLNNEAHRNMGRSSSQEADWESMSSAKFIQRSNQ